MVAVDLVFEQMPPRLRPADGVDAVAVVVRRRKLVELDVQVAGAWVDAAVAAAHAVFETARRARCIRLGTPEVVVGVCTRHRLVADISRATRRPDVAVLPKHRRSVRRVGPRLAHVEPAVAVGIAAGEVRNGTDHIIGYRHACQRLVAGIGDDVGPVHVV